MMAKQTKPLGRRAEVTIETRLLIHADGVLLVFSVPVGHIAWSAARARTYAAALVELADRIEGAKGAADG
jgi:hypothetical protein